MFIQVISVLFYKTACDIFIKWIGICFRCILWGWHFPQPSQTEHSTNSGGSLSGSSDTCHHSGLFHIQKHRTECIQANGIKSVNMFFIWGIEFNNGTWWDSIHMGPWIKEWYNRDVYIDQPWLCWPLAGMVPIDNGAI